MHVSHAEHCAVGVADLFVVVIVDVVCCRLARRLENSRRSSLSRLLLINRLRFDDIQLVADYP